MRLLKLLLVLFICGAARGFVLVLAGCGTTSLFATAVSPARAQAANFDDVEAQIRVKEASNAASAAARKVEALRKELEAERQRVVQTVGERDLSQATVKALEQELRSAETKQREQDAALKAAQDVRTQGLAAEAQRRMLEKGRQQEATPAKRDEQTKLEAKQQAERVEAALNLSDQDRKRVQTALTALGHQIPTATGYFGPLTRTMITAWQKKQGLPETGFLDQSQLVALHEQAAQPPPASPALQQQVAGSYEDALAAYKTGDYATALRLLRPLAEKDAAGAQFCLGVMYEAGQGVQQDYAAAVSWYRKAVGQGEAFAQNNLGVMYQEGQGVPQDYATAASWYRKSAEQGNATAQYNLGVMYQAGQGVPQDYATAASWYRKSAEQGKATAQYNLGFVYQAGQGAPQDYVQAHKWYSLAASRFAASEKENRDNAIKGRDFVAAKMTPAQIAEAQRQAREWKPKPER